jgi:Domain of unknown function (DUF397)
MADGSNGEPVWRRGKKCESGACVEVAAADGIVMVRSSASQSSTVVMVTRDMWREFLADVKDGDFEQCAQNEVSASKKSV